MSIRPIRAMFLGLAAAAAGGALVANPSAAAVDHATPAQVNAYDGLCYVVGDTPMTTHSACTDGATGQHRVRVLCAGIGGPDVIYGPWVSTTSKSSASCAWGQWADSASAERR